MQAIQQRITILGLWVWFIAALFFLYEFFLRTFVGSIAHQVIADLHLTIEQFTLIGSAYYFAYAAMQMPVGVLADKFGVKLNMIVATLACAAATFLFAHSTGFASAVLGRVLMGLGSSFAFVCLLVIASNWFPRQYFAFFAGASQFIGTMGPVLAGGPLITWLVDTHTNWRIALSGIALFGLVLSILSLLFVKDKPKGAKKRLLFLSKTEPILFRLKHLFKTPQTWVVALYSATNYVSIAAIAAVWGTDFLQAKGLPQQSAAYMISIAWIAYAIGCPGFGFLSDLSRRRKPYFILCALLGLMSTLLIIYAPIHAMWQYEALFFMLGLAATGQNLGFAAIAEHNAPDVKASALGLNNGVIVLLGAILPLLIGAVITHVSHGGNADHLSVLDFQYGLAFLPLMYVIALVLSLFFFKETYCRPQNEMLILGGENSSPRGH
ncbi:MAG: MFS transporter [Gammaproteobacteria bacterium CG11_big_fil_rev_8_21_14_0_20_46_22]|nr:MAG: MFS transporter [Gammaproteobacteria bacterium CG12_big_fil_rev_8_21_14_0_65_46_12]PIR10088.1 MAG: MFS transporter [Gammaproteobacteria bacterium CG11_big_fil_rev_8_21_14_0_20_46_22]